MARPVKTADQKRDRGAGVRFTEEEFAVIAAKADASGVTFSEFLRIAALNLPLPKALKTASSPLSFSVANELRRVGVNLNQIARLSHMGIERTDELTPLLEDIQQILATIHGEGV